MIALLRSILIAFCIVATFMSVGCASKPKSTPPPVDVRLEQLGATGMNAFRRGEYEQAKTFFERALARAYLRDDIKAASNHSYHLAACLLRMREYDDAMRFVNESRLAISMMNSEFITADIDLLEAAVLYRKGDLDEALNVLRDARSNAVPGMDVIKARSWCMEASILAAQGNASGARAALSNASLFPIAINMAAYRMASGHVLKIEGDAASAAVQFDQAADGYRMALDYEGMTDALLAAAASFASSGDEAAAADRYLRAGRSFSLQGRPADAKAALQAAITTAHAADRPAIVSDARKWLTALPSDTAAH